jgi:ADP-heptose:LPS heptosyltransferase
MQRPGRRREAMMKQVGSTVTLENARAILVVKLDRVGDFILLSPFLRGLRKSAPLARIDLLVAPMSLPVANLCPYVDGVFGITMDQAAVNITGKDAMSGDALIGRFKTGYYDIAVVPRWDHDSYGAGAVAKASNAARVFGFSSNSNPIKRRNNQGFDEAFYTDVLDAPSCAHEVSHNLELLRFLGGTADGEHLEIWTTADDDAEAERRLGAFGRGAPLVAISPGSSESERVLPISKLCAILSRVADWNPEIRFAVIGGPAEIPAAEMLVSRLPLCRSWCGDTTLTQHAAMIRHCTAAISMCSAPAQIAAAMQVPTIVFSSHPLDGDPLECPSPERFRPWGTMESLFIQPPYALWPCSASCNADVPHCIINIPDDLAVDSITGFVMAAHARSARNF